MQRAIGTGLVEKRKVKQAKTRIAAAHFTTSSVSICHSSEEKQKMVVCGFVCLSVSALRASARFARVRVRASRGSGHALRAPWRFAPEGDLSIL